MERYTSIVCPSCRSVCCIDRHGAYDEADIAFFSALGENPASSEPKAADTEPCRHLAGAGCGLPRWRRPYRCTWYFCASLLDAMDSESSKDYREFMGALERLQSLRARLSYLVG